MVGTEGRYAFAILAGASPPTEVMQQAGGSACRPCLQQLCSDAPVEPDIGTAGMKHCPRTESGARNIVRIKPTKRRRRFPVTKVTLPCKHDSWVMVKR
jgi:hypothetical protein